MINAHNKQLDEHESLLRNKYDKSGGKITVEDNNHAVHITSTRSLDYSKLKV